MTEGVVDCLEVVDIDQCQPQRLLAAQAHAVGALQHVVEMAAIGQVGQPVDLGQLAALAATGAAQHTPECLPDAGQGAADAPVNIRHMAALTRARAGREMVEMSFLQDAGAVAFTDGVRVVADARLMSRCMTYARGLGALIVGHPQEPVLSKGTAATSGKFASLYGLPAVSPMAEVMGLDRDLALVAMTGGAGTSLAPASPPCSRSRCNAARQ